MQNTLKQTVFCIVIHTCSIISLKLNFNYYNIFRKYFQNKRKICRTGECSFILRFILYNSFLLFFPLLLGFSEQTLFGRLLFRSGFLSLFLRGHRLCGRARLRRGSQNERGRRHHGPETGGENKSLDGQIHGRALQTNEGRNAVCRCKRTERAGTL